MPHSERVRLAQELHDGLAQELVSIGYSIDLILGAPDTPAQTRTDLRTLRFSVTDLISHVRTEIFNLRSQDVEEQLRALADSVSHICADRLGVLDISPIEISGSVCQEICKIALELVRNSLKHSGATAIDLSLNQSDDLIMLRVSDNGNGKSVKTLEGFGLQGVRERCLTIDGNLSLITCDSGTEVSLELHS